MAGFDPDQYLQKKAAPQGGFDPDAYLLSKSGDEDEFAPLKSSSKVKEEMHPSFSWKDRGLVKTFGNDLGAAARFLQERHPDLEVKLDKGGIVARGPGESEYRPLDPDTGFFSKDFGYDLLDVAGDIGTGVVTTGATAGGALAGAALGAGAGGIGAVPGAMIGGSLGGGASAAGLEALRQLAGKGIGVNEEISGTDIALQGGIGAASPLLFGGGATMAQAGAKAAGKGALTYANPFLGAKEGAANLAKSTARTVLPKGLAAKIPANIASQIPSDAAEALLRAQSGLPVQAFRKAKGILPKLGETTSGIQADVIKTWAADPAGVENLTEGGVRNLMVDTIDSVGAKLGERKETIGETMNTLRSLADDFGQLGRKNDEIYRVQMDTVTKPFRDMISKVDDVANRGGTRAEQKQAKALSDVFEDYFVREVPTTGIDDFGEPIVERTLDKSLTANEAFALKDRLLDVAEFDQPTNPIRQAARDAIREIDRQIELVTKRSGKVGRRHLKTELDPDASYRYLQDEYKILKDSSSDVAQLLRNPKAAYNLLSNLGNKNRITELEAIKAFDAQYGTKIAEMAKKLTAHKQFSNAPWLAMSGGGTTSTSRTVPLSDSFGSLGYFLGANSGLGQGGAGIGSAVGSAMGSYVGGPAAIKRYSRWNNAIGKGQGLMRDAGAAPNRIVAPWVLMEQRRIEE